MGYVFISYSSLQQKQLSRVKEYLKFNGISFWAAPDDIPLGSKYSEVITRAITNASCVLFLLSDRSQNSTYCKLEIALAVKHEKPVIPIQLEDVILNDDFTQYLDGSNEFFPLPKRYTTSKSVRLLNQLRLLCADPDQGPVEFADPSYKLGWFRKGTWLQILGWIWIIAGYIPFIRLADLLFTVPPLYDSYGGDGLDWFNAPLIAQNVFRSGVLVALLVLLGLLLIFYGFSLNRQKYGKRRLYFKQFSLCQMLLLIAWVGYGVSAPLAMENFSNHLGHHYSSFWVDASGYIFSAAFVLCLVTLGIWLTGMIRRALRGRKAK